MKKRMVSIMPKKVIDVSYAQGLIDWGKVKGQVDGAILQAGYGSDFIYQDDVQFERNAAECERLGIPYGIYIYSYAQTEAQAHSEASHVLRLASGKKLSYPIYFDAEQAGTEGVAKRNADIFCIDIENAGYFAGIYANENWWRNYLTGLENYTKWVAKYSTNKPAINNYDAWQFSDCALINGINGGVDISYFYRDFPAEINKAAPKEKTTDATANKKSLKEIAKDVVKGKWGNGKKRVKKLKQAGFTQEEIDKIQEFVNDLTYTAIAKQIVSGKWGNGEKRIKKLMAAGYDNAAIKIIQNKVNKLMGV